MSWLSGPAWIELRQSRHGTWLFAASSVAGALNAMAGGGSFLSFPALLGAGAPPIQANATNTVALWPGQFTSIAAYLPDLRVNRRLLFPIISAAGVGGLGGALILLRTGQATFLALVPWLLLVAALLFAVSGPVSRWVKRRAEQHASSLPQSRSAGMLMLGLWACVAVVCFYIGYFGAGAGFLLMSVLGLFGIDEVNQINALKVVATTIANGIAVITFILAKEVVWQYCLLMMVGAALGGYLGGRYARRLDPRLMRLVVVAIGLSMAGYFFWKQFG